MTGLVARFLPALRDPALPVPDGLTDGTGRPAGRRFNVYRNNVTVSLIEALAQGFPAIHSLIGADNFAFVARGYATAHPPQSPLMMHYGAAFPTYLAEQSALAHLPYLPDVARLDLALRASYHAADHTPFDADDLARIAPEELENKVLHLAPGVRLLRSRWPVAQIHAFALSPDAPKPQGGPQDVAVFRPGFDPVAHELPPGGHAFLTLLQAHRPLGPATEAATAIAPAFDLGAMLALLLSQNALAQQKV